MSCRKCGLNAAAKAAGKLYFGTAVDASGLTDRQYSSILKNPADFGQITPANAQKVLSQYVSARASTELIKVGLDGTLKESVLVRHR